MLIAALLRTGEKVTIIALAPFAIGYWGRRTGEINQALAMCEEGKESQLLKHDVMVYV